MRLTLACIGRQKSGAERDLAERYLERARLAGRAAGLVVDLRELAEGRSRSAPERKREEAAALRACVEGCELALFDERGDGLDSPGFAALVGRARDSGTARLTLAIGGADGLDEALHREAKARIAFGAMTWPHQLVRVMACEQIYRAVTLLTGHPYHRA